MYMYKIIYLFSVVSMESCSVRLIEMMFYIIIEEKNVLQFLSKSAHQQISLYSVSRHSPHPPEVGTILGTNDHN